MTKATTPKSWPELEALTAKQKAFVLAYVQDKNATKAAKIAGYKGTENSIRTSASKLLTNANVKRAIDAFLAPAIKKAEVTVDRVIQELAALGFGDMGQIIDFDLGYPRLKTNLTPDSLKLLSSVKVRTVKDDEEEAQIVEFKLWDKVSALTKLGDHVGAFKNANSGDVPQGLAIIKNLSESDARDLLALFLKKR